MADAAARAERTLVTPEGVDLRLQIASAGQRAAAFLLDAAIIVGVLIGATIVLALVGVGAAWVGGGEILMVIWLLAFFFLRNFYFTAFELGARGATPGKRAMGIRVASRDGGRLTSEAVFARNAMRELEVFMPLSLLAAPGQMSNGWVALLAFGWCCVFVFFPLFNRDKLRTGDIVGGTWVVRAPRRRLARDMSEDGVGQLPTFAFTPAQLEAYGVHELQVLEEVLRHRDPHTLHAVANRIAAKIGWERRSNESAEAFLSAYYAALRQRLEQRLLMGVRRRDKFDV